MTPVQMRMARAALGWGVRDLADQAGVTANTVSRIETGADAKQSTVAALKAALEAGGVEFIAENGGGAGVRLRKGGKASTDHPEPTGPATDVVKSMDAAIDSNRSKKR